MVTSRSRGRSSAPKKRGGNPRHRKTVAKADTVEVKKDTAAIQFVLPLGKDIQLHLTEIKEAKDKAATLNGKVRNAYKAAKAAKVNRKLVDFLLSLERSDGDEVRQEMEELALGLQTIGAPFRIVVYAAKYKDPIEQAKIEGTAQAKVGRAAEPRYEEDTPAHDAYMEAYSFQQAKMTPGADQLPLDELKKAAADGREAARH